MNSSNPHRCSFCNDKINHHNAIQGEEAVICYSCINQSKQILDQNIAEKENASELERLQSKLLYPQQILDRLNEYIIGQDQTKKILSVAVYHHYKRIINLLENNHKKIDDVEIDKSNILLIGPSGSGKTLLASVLAKILGVPFAIADATTLTEAGYVGDDVENILLRLIQNANHKISWAEKGIIFIDEIDKIGRKSENTSLTRDVSGEGVQQALLKIIEGTVATVPPQGGRKHPQSQNLSINTKNILFVCGGAFVGIDKLIEKRTNLATIGFTSGESSQLNQQKSQFSNDLALAEVTPDDLTQFGLIPEIVGRLPVTSKLKELTHEELSEILTKPKNAIIKQYQKLFSLDHKELVIDKDGIDFIIEQAKQYQTGARALRSIIEKILLPVSFSIHKMKKKKIIISKNGLIK